MYVFASMVVDEFDANKQDHIGSALGVCVRLKSARV